MSTNEAKPLELYPRLALDDDDDEEHGGRSLEDQIRYEQTQMKDAEAFVGVRTPAPPPLPKSLFVKDGQFIAKADGSSWRSFEFVVKDLGIAVGPPTLLIAASYSGKTFLLQHLALCAVSGRKFLDQYEVKQGKVIHLDYEQGTDQSEVRYQRLMNGHGIRENELRSGELLFARPSIMLDHADAEKELVFLTHGYSLCIIDSYRAALGKIDENSSEARGPLTMLGNVSEQTKCVFIVIHHQGKGETPRGERTWGRGSSAIFDAAGTVFSLKVENNVYELRQEKSRIGRFSGAMYKLEDAGKNVEALGLSEGVRLVHMAGASPKEIREKADTSAIILALREHGPLSATDLQRESGLSSKPRYLKARDELVTEKTIIPGPGLDKRGTIYRLSEAYVAKADADAAVTAYR